MKKTLVLTAIFFCLLAGAARAHDYADTLRVGLKYGNNAAQSVTLSAEGGVVVYNAQGHPLSGPVQSAVISKGLLRGFISTGLFDYSDGDEITVKSADGSPVSVDGAAYRGYIHLMRRTNSDMTVVNVVGTEEYLYSVLGREMSASWPAEALKAQAMCARNYAVCSLGKHGDYGFDLCPTTDCQVYAGVAAEAESTIAAVEATRGQMVTYGGGAVPLFYFATDGGMTESAENVWGSEVGYLKGVSDPYEDPEIASRYTWTSEITLSELNSRLATKDIDIGSLTGMRINEISSSGRALSLTLIGTEGEKTVLREKVRTTLGTDRIYSQSFTFEKTGGAGTVRLYSASGQTAPDASVITGAGVKTLAGSFVIGSNGVIQKSAENAGGEERYIFTGRGYGHGVGMSQWGARGMAERGFTYDQIIKFYYTGVEIEIPGGGDKYASLGL